MKKIFLLALLALPFLSTFAQTDVDPKFHFGMRVTPSLCWQRSDNSNVESDGNLFRASYGFVADFKFATNYAFSTGIDVSYKGGKLKRTNSSVSGDTTTSMLYEESLKSRYIEIPLTIRLKTNQIGLVKYYLQAGIAPSFNFKGFTEGTVTTQRTATAYTNTTEQNVDQTDVNDDINLFNLSMVIGAGVEYNLTGTTNLVLGLVFTNGFLDATDKKNTNPVLQDSKLFANQLGLNIGILF